MLAVLATAGRPLTVGQVAAEAARGSEIGVRRSLARLVEQGTVRATLMGRNHVHELNRDHVAAQVAVLLAGLRLELWERFRAELRSWKVPPLYAAVFGSAARGDGDVDSDIDLIVVHQVFSGEKKPKSFRSDIRTQVADAAGAVTLSATDRDADTHWESQLADLHDRVERWTGNPLQIVDLSFYEWRHPPQEYQRLLSDVRRDGVELIKARGLKIWSTSEPADG